ncbi:hypothetical protein Rhsp01_09670 [Rhizobium sp. NBRC 114257]|nr:hypothetical protein Rhsp01_09670 [Rhizobium sp. NBRC 114257]
MRTDARQRIGGAHGCIEQRGQEGAGIGNGHVELPVSDVLVTIWWLNWRKDARGGNRNCVLRDESLFRKKEFHAFYFKDFSIWPN